MAVFEPVQVAALPESLVDFVALRDAVARTPQGGAAMMVVALLLYVADEALGGQCLAATVHRERLRQGPDGFEGWQLDPQDLQLVELQVRKQPYLPLSYVRQATPQNGYALPAPPYEVECAANVDSEGGSTKVLVGCSGATARTVTVKKDEQGLWKMSEWSSLLVGIRNPA